ncbi:MAG: NUDIX hydrolase [Syntrophobacterales bacterium]|nr:NUDIX hydrolase [Syntrophobacterales bacterium]
MIQENSNPRLYPPRPIVGVGGIVFDGDRVLLGLRGKEPGMGKWSIPGGVVRLGETIEEALVREMEEEVGIKVKVNHVVAILDRIIKDESGNVAYHYILVDFLCTPICGRKPRAASDLLDCRYIPISELKTYPLTRGTAFVIEHSFNQLKNPFPPYVIYDNGWLS